MESDSACFGLGFLELLRASKLGFPPKIEIFRGRLECDTDLNESVCRHNTYLVYVHIHLGYNVFIFLLPGNKTDVGQGRPSHKPGPKCLPYLSVNELATGRGQFVTARRLLQKQIRIDANQAGGNGDGKVFIISIHVAIQVYINMSRCREHLRYKYIYTYIYIYVYICTYWFGYLYVTTIRASQHSSCLRSRGPTIQSTLIGTSWNRLLVQLWFTGMRGWLAAFPLLLFGQYSQNKHSWPSMFAVWVMLARRVSTHQAFCW